MNTIFKKLLMSCFLISIFIVGICYAADEVVIPPRDGKETATSLLSNTVGIAYSTLHQDFMQALNSSDQITAITAFMNKYVASTGLNLLKGPSPVDTAVYLATIDPNAFNAIAIPKFSGTLDDGSTFTFGLSKRCGDGHDDDCDDGEDDFSSGTTKCIDTFFLAVKNSATNVTAVLTIARITKPGLDPLFMVKYTASTLTANNKKMILEKASVTAVQKLAANQILLTKNYVAYPQQNIAYSHRDRIGYNPLSMAVASTFLGSYSSSFASAQALREQVCPPTTIPPCNPDQQNC